MFMGEQVIFHMMHEENLLADATSLYLLLANRRQRNTGSLQWEGSCQVVCKLDLK